MANSSKPLLRVLAGGRESPPPVWLMRQAGRYLPEYREVRAKAGSFLDLCFDPELAAEVTLQPIRRFGFDAAIVFADILLIPKALGVELDFREGEGPVLSPVRSAEDVGRLASGQVEERLAPIFETLRRVRAELAPECTLIGFAGAPWTVAAYMVEGRGGTDFSNLIGWAWTEPGSFGELIATITDATVAYLTAQVRAGAEVVQLFDSWAGAAAEPLFRKWCIAPAAEIVRRLHESCPGTPVIGFPRGAAAMMSAYVEETGVDAVSLDPGIPVATAVRLQEHCAVQGNLDPQLLRAGGAAMVTEIRRIVAGLAAGPHVFNLGHGIHKDTPPDHVALLVETVRAGAAA